MKNIWLIIQREYKSRVFNRWFILSTIVFPIAILLFTGFSAYLGSLSGTQERTIGILDSAGLLQNSIQSRNNLTFIFIQGTQDEWRERIHQESLDGFVFIPENISLSELSSIQYFSRNPIDFTTQITLSEILSERLTNLRFQESGLDFGLIQQLQVNIGIENIVIGDDGETSSNSIVSLAVGYVTGLMIYIILLVYGSMVMQSVLEEKSNRIVEIIISSVKPVQLLLGKIVGVAFVGITQFMLWGVILGFIYGGISIIFRTDILLPNQNSTLQNPQIESIRVGIETTFSSLDSINPVLIFTMFLLYFIGGYLMYASLFAAVATLGETEQDTRNLTLPIMLPIIIAFLLMFQAISNPDGQIAFWGSIFPFTSPIVMMARLPLGVPIWQLILSLTLLVFTFCGTTLLAARIYRIGILRYGKSSLQDAFLWLRPS